MMKPPPISPLSTPLSASLNVISTSGSSTLHGFSPQIRSFPPSEYSFPLIASIYIRCRSSWFVMRDCSSRMEKTCPKTGKLPFRRHGVRYSSVIVFRSAMTFSLSDTPGFRIAVQRMFTCSYRGLTIRRLTQAGAYRFKVFSISFSFHSGERK